jgi:hypothetical protein
MALERTTGLSELAGFGFINLEPALKNLEELTTLIGLKTQPLLEFVSKSQNPDQALELLLRLSRSHPSELKTFSTEPAALGRLCLILKNRELMAALKK